MAFASRVQSVFTADKRATPFARGTACTRVVSIPNCRKLSVPVLCQAGAASQAPVYKGDLLNKTYYPTSADASKVRKQWYIINAEGQTLGRLACLAAWYIRGKHSPGYAPSMDMGAYIIVINAEKVKVTGSKYTDKSYFSHVNGRPGSWRMEPFKDLQQRLPERIIEHAVKGMLPKGRLGRDIRLHLKVFKGAKHPHEAQQPLDITKEINRRPSEGPGAQLRSSMQVSK